MTSMPTSTLTPYVERSMIFELLEQQRRTMDFLTGRNSVMRMLQDQKRMADLTRSQLFALKMVTDNRRAIDLARGPTSTFQAIERSRRVTDLISGRNSIFQSLENSRKLMDTITARPQFAATMGMNDTLAAISSRPYFSTMIGTATMPRPAWIETIESLRTAIGNPLYADVVTQFDEAAELAEDGDEDGDEDEDEDESCWWIERLPLGTQFALLFVLLEVIDKMSELGQAATGVHLPPAYTAAVQVLFALAAAILALVDARAKAVANDEATADDDGGAE